MSEVAAAMAAARGTHPRYEDAGMAVNFAVGYLGFIGGWPTVVAAARAGDTTAVELLCVLAETA